MTHADALVTVKLLTPRRSAIPMKALPPPEELHRSLSQRDLKELVKADLPGWFKATAAADADGIVLREDAFGTSPHELLLLAAAIKYAAGTGKHVHVIGRFEEANRNHEQTSQLLPPKKPLRHVLTKVIELFRMHDARRSSRRRSRST